MVLKLQNRIKNSFDKTEKNNGQIVIYGKKGHAEVIGLSGQTNEKAIIIMNENDMENVDFSKPITLYSQTTKSTEGFYKMKSLIEERIANNFTEDSEENILKDFDANDSICRQVSNREPQLIHFSKENDVILFVSGKKSSNGIALFEVCKKTNKRSYFIENEQDINKEWFLETDNIGICGATSTPNWLMEKVKMAI